ncbi:hypothetical protein JTE90_025552 [Oedothorax gibbosus]|uniref:Uncharacterized protein n=1 Tax=Oedothorax gibbosus TaxID=931172 RepID=A0AAV6TXP1_9ARAC|nr:hypothetical protein JTE90_025552 [Oedothorax gibbosus]
MDTQMPPADNPLDEIRRNDLEYEALMALYGFSVGCVPFLQIDELKYVICLSIWPSDTVWTQVTLVPFATVNLGTTMSRTDCPGSAIVTNAIIA